MPRKSSPRSVGRPDVLGEGAAYRTVKLRRDQIAFVNRFAGPAAGQKPKAIRDLLDLGIAVVRKRATRS